MEPEEIGKICKVLRIIVCNHKYCECFSDRKESNENNILVSIKPLPVIIGYSGFLISYFSSSLAEAHPWPNNVKE